MSVGCAQNKLRRNDMLRENVRKWKHETRKQANMHNGIASRFRGTTQTYDGGNVTVFSKPRQIASRFFSHYIFLRFCGPKVKKAKQIYCLNGKIAFYRS